MAFSLVAVLLMLGGPWINRTVKRLVKGLPWILRYLTFVILCSIGYGTLATWGVRWILHVVTPLENGILVIVVSVAYLVLAWFAKRERAI